jgi:hypothetical protein
MELILEDPNLRVEMIDIIKPSVLNEGILVDLMAIYNEKAGYTCHGGTTHMLVMYDCDVIVGGALLRLTASSVVIKRLCTMITLPEHSSKIVRCLQYFYPESEVHVSANAETSQFYSDHNFSKRNISHRCLCKSKRNMTHLVWSVKATSPQVVTRHKKGVWSDLHKKNLIESAPLIPFTYCIK